MTDAHNILLDSQGTSFLGDFGAATWYSETLIATDDRLEKVEVRAFGLLLDDVIQLLERNLEIEPRGLIERLSALKESCVRANVLDRPSFSSILSELSTWRPICLG